MDGGSRWLCGEAAVEPWAWTQTLEEGGVGSQPGLRSHLRFLSARRWSSVGGYSNIEP